MTDPRDDSLDRLLRQTLRRTPNAGATPSCLDAETMAAWMDGGLSGESLAAVEAHAAQCQHCRARAAVMARSATVEQQAAEISSKAPEGLHARNWLPWLVPLAAAALIAIAIWIPRREEQPAQESRIALAPPAETAPQAPPSGQIGERRQTPQSQQEAPPAAAKEIRPAEAASARGDQPEFRREKAAAAAPVEPPAVSQSQPPATRSAAPQSPQPSSEPVRVPPPPAPATAVTGGAPVVTPPANAFAVGALDRAAADTVLAEFQSPAAQAPSFRTGATADSGAARGGRAGGAAVAPAGTGAGTGPGAAAGGRGGGGGAGGRGGGGRGGAAPIAALAETIAVTESQPVRWRVLASGIVQRSNPPGAPWEPVAIEPAGARVTSGAAPSPLVCWLVGRNGVVFLTIDGRSFTRVTFPETADLASVAATSARDATVTTTDGRTFRTMDGGQTWGRQ